MSLSRLFHPCRLQRPGSRNNRTLYIPKPSAVGSPSLTARALIHIHVLCLLTEDDRCESSAGNQLYTRPPLLLLFDRAGSLTCTTCGFRESFFQNVRPGISSSTSAIRLPQFPGPAECFSTASQSLPRSPSVTFCGVMPPRGLVATSECTPLVSTVYPSQCAVLPRTIPPTKF
ncbi:hypothetical protein LX32DRAFT_434942 [Colletotrichum zoysiae]|uniref:Uncharacterized protein n=1 Tax=Colletotrichum zoysiae TaxID=1216348 RepID=A0AAD9HGL7_9PEZI|nr:hypothetical protein LX32DRAFT_434942 [Colletotrichum zoysiae]